MKDARVVLAAERVGYAYTEGTRALDGVSLALHAGTFTALLASNGSGKTTLLKCLCGLLTPCAGRVLIEGRPLADWQDGERAALVGVVLQNPDDQLFCPTVAEDVAFGPRNLDLPEAEVQDRVREALEAVEAAHLAGRAIHHLSFGEQKRVCLAGVLAMRPQVLVLDEPTAGLDPQGEAAMLRLLHRLNRTQGLTVLLATHAVDLLPLFAHRIVVLNRGRTIMDGLPAEVFSDPEILARCGLRLPWVSHLLHELSQGDGLPVDRLPLTLGEARTELLKHLPEHLLDRAEQEAGP
jgi:cobalt/nickel transport system ATP-binding protein